MTHRPHISTPPPGFLRENEAAALRAALRTGWHCFPCLANKAPACPSGFHAATKDPATLMDLWGRHPGVQVGVATGPRSGIVCLDIDCGQGKANTASARAWLEENEYRLPITWRHETRSGGIHVLFSHARGFRCSTSLIALGVDTKGEARAAGAGDTVDGATSSSGRQLAPES